MPNSNIEVIEELYAAVACGDGPAVVVNMDPEIVWNEAEHFPYADRNPYIGPAAIAEGVFFRLATEWENFQALPEEFFDAGSVIVTTGRYCSVHKLTGKRLNAQFAHIWTLQDGRIVRFQQYTDTAQASDAIERENV